MSKYYELIKQNIIEFDRLLLDKYYLLNLNETEALLLIKLHNFIKQGNHLPSSSLIASQMYITEEECNYKIVDLVNKGYLDMLHSSEELKETYCLDQTYQRLAYILENDERQIERQNYDYEIKRIAQLLEKEWKKILSAFDLEIITSWVIEKEYLYEDVESAVLKGLKNNQTNIRYVDRILVSMYQDVEDVKQNESGKNIKELFEEVYLGSKRNF